MSKLTSEEVDKLEKMYAGDKARDASSKVRGFLYQDYVTIMCLLQEHVECVCSEYLEDVDVFYDDGRFEYIQVKYYPASNPDMSEISTDLYYQYLRLLLLDSKLNIVPTLYVYRDGTTRKLTKEKLKSCVEKIVSIPSVIAPVDSDDFVLWLENNINTITDKEKQKKILFEKWASEKNIEEFVDVMKILSTANISDYKEELKQKLSVAYPNSAKKGNDKNWQVLLLGLAITYIQRRYNLTGNDFNSIRVDKAEFDKYMKSSIQTKTEETIAAYLLGIVTEVYDNIIMHNTSLSDLKKNMLDRICKNTLDWIEDLGSTKEGQYKLLYICSYKEATEIFDFKNEDIEERLGLMREVRETFVDFLKYLWKIMLNICVKNVTSLSQIPDHLDLYDPVTYVDASQADYICLNFPEDHTNHSVILPSAKREFKGTKRKLIDRFINLNPVPEKWFFDNTDNLQGKNYFDYRVTDVRKRATIADKEKDGFWIECMQCIGIDEGDWDMTEDCSACIFKDTCVKYEGG